MAAKEDYSDVEWLNLESGRTGFVWLEALRDLLADFGWEDSHILELRHSLNQEEVSQALDWLATNADTDDLVIFYIGAHGRFLRQGLEWADFISHDWGSIDSQRRVLVVEACHAGEFTSAVAGDPRPQLTIASVRSDEYSWYGVPEEGLPILGGVFTYYLMEAFKDSAADSDGDGAVSIQEAAVHADVQQRDYMRDVVWVVPEFRVMYEELGVDVEDPEYPRVVIEDSIREPVYLDLAEYCAPGQESLCRGTMVAPEPTPCPAAPTSTHAPVGPTATPTTEVREAVEVSLLAEEKWVLADTPIVLRISWVTDAPEQVTDFLNSVEFVVSVDGLLVEDTGKYWSQIEEAGDRDQDGDMDYMALWLCPVGVLAQGTHRVESEMRLRWPVVDGFDSDGDGAPDEYSGPLQFSLQIVVGE